MGAGARVCWDLVDMGGREGAIEAVHAIVATWMCAYCTVSHGDALFESRYDTKDPGFARLTH